MRKLMPNNGMGKYIFLSYPHKNGEQAARIIEALQNAGYRVWFDEGLELGAKYNQVIAEHIEGCEVFMCLLSLGYYRSKYCRMEFAFALEECEKEIIPVFMGDTKRIRKSFPAGMRIFLTGVNAFTMTESVDINDFMHKITQTSILDVCKEEQAVKKTTEEQESDSKPKRKLKVGRGVLSRWIELPNAAVDPFKELNNAKEFWRLNEIKESDIIEFGNYWQDAEGKVKSPIEWHVLDKMGNFVFVISKYVLDCKPYHGKWESVTWETCTLRKWLNESFYDEAFSNEERKRIAIKKAPMKENPQHNTGPGKLTEDKVFLLDIEGSDKFFHEAKERKCLPTAFADSKGIYHDGDSETCAWWLRSPGNFSNFAALVYDDGGVDTNGLNVCSVVVGVRPALWLTLDP